MTIKASAVTIEEALKDMPKAASEYFSITDDVKAWVFSDGVDKYAIWREGAYTTYVDETGEHPVDEETLARYKQEAEKRAKLFNLTFTGETTVLAAGTKFRADNIQETGATAIDVMFGVDDFYAYAMKL